jgi:FkbM family methyltransferase
MRLLATLQKPEFVFRPRQILLRWQRGRTPAVGEQIARLPWGVPLAISPTENIGWQVWLTGIFDLAVTETLWRLVDPGELAIDVGANLGYMSSVLAARAGARGQVWAFEPHPTIFGQLERNLDRWKALNRLARVTAHRVALGESPGTATLWTPPRSEFNVGLSRIGGPPLAQGEAFQVPVARLDSLLAPETRVGLLKVDVEGRELDVLRGAAPGLERGQVRDIVFEDHAAYPSAVSRFLEERGFRIFSLRLRLTGLVVHPAQNPTLPLRPWDSPSCLATREPERALPRLRKLGWRSLAGNHR